MVNQIYPPESQLNKANTSETEAPFLDLYLSISNGFLSFKIYGNFDFDIGIVFFWMAMFHVVSFIGCIFRYSYDLLECVVM